MNRLNYVNGSEGFSKNNNCDSKPTSSLTSVRWLSTKEAAQYLGISTGSLLNLVWRGKVPYVKLGRLNRYSPVELERLLCVPKGDPKKGANLWE